ncbi:MAG TPA: hypothetical protein ENG34_00605 [Candidatus Aenigmarchaeota archaeon]|nr:hypothetical protein [Candidatus Aenigmarchaeota archaeon]
MVFKELVEEQLDNLITATNEFKQTLQRVESFLSKLPQDYELTPEQYQKLVKASKVINKGIFVVLDNLRESYKSMLEVVDLPSEERSRIEKAMKESLDLSLKQLEELSSKALRMKTVGDAVEYVKNAKHFLDILTDRISKSYRGLGTAMDKIWEDMLARLKKKLEEVL